MTPRKPIAKIVSVSLIGVLLWLGWPIYGFLSQQYETARAPWGWSAAPSELPEASTYVITGYVAPGEEALAILQKRRETINAPSLSAAVAINGEIVWAGATGWADIKAQTPATTQTSYRIGSTSKPVGITGLAKLVDDKKVDLDVPLSTYASDLPNAAWQEVTLRQLASHMAGIAAYEENTDWVGFYQSLALQRRFDHPKAALSVFDGSKRLYPPESKFHYSGYDNVLISAVLSEATDIPYDDVMAQYVFDPLGLTSIKADHLTTTADKVAVSYQIKNAKFKPWRSVDLSHKLAAGGYVANPSELALLGAAWLDDDFISPSVRETFWTPATLSTGDVNEQDYALGFRRKSWPIEGVGEVEHLNHGGVSKGAQCWLMIVPEYNLVLVISTNRRTEQFFDFADVYVDLLEVFIPASQKQNP